MSGLTHPDTAMNTSYIETLIAKAAHLCQQKGLRLTPLRRDVLRLIYQSAKPLGAYEILDSLYPEQGRRPAPPTVYRSLEFLLNAGLIHRLASLNAFIACENPEHAHIAQFLICEQCGCVKELKNPHLTDDIEQQAHDLGFDIHQQIIELKGYCQKCRTA